MVTSVEPLEAELRDGIERLVEAHQRKPAGALKNGLKGRVNDELLDDVAGRIKWRNVLAHRYLRERLRRGDQHTFKPGTLDELTRLTYDFDREPDLGTRRN